MCASVTQAAEDAFVAELQQGALARRRVVDIASQRHLDVLLEAAGSSIVMACFYSAVSRLLPFDPLPCEGLAHKRVARLGPP